MDPWDPAMVQPASVDLGSAARSASSTTTRSRRSTWPTRRPTSPSTWRSSDGGEFVIHPGEFVLGRTAELVELPDDVVARIEGNRARSAGSA